MKILHLYHDIMNLYGEYANVAALKRMLEKNDVACEVDTLSVGDELKILDYDFIYIGSGTESNQKYVMEHLKKYVDDVKAYVEAGKFLFMTGNSFEILGKKIIDAKGKAHAGLGLFDFTVTVILSLVSTLIILRVLSDPQEVIVITKNTNKIIQLIFLHKLLINITPNLVFLLHLL